MTLRTVLTLLAPAALLAQPMPEQVKRGEALFSTPGASGASCATCHALAGKGVAVGPNLAEISRLHPRAIVTAILATRTQYVRDITILENGKKREFPAMKSGENEFWDLSAIPPVKRTLAAKDITNDRDNQEWKHPPESRGLTKPQLADLIAYIRFASFGDTKPVDPAQLP